MSEHVFDELPAILRGELARTQLEAAAIHLRRCPDCQQELISALVAHASLTSASRVSSATVSLSPSEGSQPLGSKSTPSMIADYRTDALTEASAPLPDLSNLFAQVRAEAAAEAALPKKVMPQRPQDTDRRSRGRWLAAAAIIVAVGGGAGTYVATSGRGPAAGVTTVALAAYDQGHAPAEATVASGDMRINATSLPKPTNGKLYEVWLTDAGRTRMHALGWIDPNGKGDFTVPASLMQEYSAIEVSVQDLAASYNYSGVSVLRGTY